MEVFRLCFENYEISNFGNCRRRLLDGSYKIVSGSILNCGYKYFQKRYTDGSRVNLLFHILVAEQFIGIRPDGLVIDHIDRDKLNNRVDNLRYVTHTENVRNSDRVITGILFDENRHSIIGKKWCENNVDRCKKVKHQYYTDNKKLLAEKLKAKDKELECSVCNNLRTISHTQYNKIKRETGLENNVCLPCTSRAKLLVINNAKSFI